VGEDVTVTNPATTTHTATEPTDPVAQTTYRDRALTITIDGATYRFWVDGTFYCPSLPPSSIGVIDMRDPVVIEMMMARLRVWIDDEQRLRERFPLGSTVQSVPQKNRHGVRRLTGEIVGHQRWLVLMRITETNYTSGDKSVIGAEVFFREGQLELPDPCEKHNTPGA
jgi:hypothetical protein